MGTNKTTCINEAINKAKWGRGGYRGKQNPIAEELSDGRYHQRVVKNKKAYDRQKHKISSRDCEWEVTDV